MKELLKKYLQNNVSNKDLVNIIEKVRYTTKHDFPDNFKKNKEAFKGHVFTIRRNKGFIEDQNNYADMSYGNYLLSKEGSGLIAIYNVIYHLTNKLDIDFPSIIKALENDGIIIPGFCGTSMIAVDDYLNSQNYRTWSSYEKSDYDKIGEATDASILTIFNDINDYTKGVPFMAITKTNGKYYVHNHEGTSPFLAFNSISDILKRINGGKAKDIYLTGVYKP